MTPGRRRVSPFMPTPGDMSEAGPDMAGADLMEVLAGLAGEKGEVSPSLDPMGMVMGILKKRMANRQPTPTVTTSETFPGIPR